MCICVHVCAYVRVCGVSCMVYVYEYVCAYMCKHTSIWEVSHGAYIRGIYVYTYEHLAYRVWCMYTSIYVHVCMSISMRVSGVCCMVHVYEYVCAYMCMCTGIGVCSMVHVYEYVSACMCIYTSI